MRVLVQVSVNDFSISSHPEPFFLFSHLIWGEGRGGEQESNRAPFPSWPAVEEKCKGMNWRQCPEPTLEGPFAGCLGLAFSLDLRSHERIGHWPEDGTSRHTRRKRTLAKLSDTLSSAGPGASLSLSANRYPGFPIQGCSSRLLDMRHDF